MPAEDSENLKSPEWKVFSNPAAALEGKDFKLRAVEPPQGYETFFERIVLAEKLREVKALVGFTRIQSPRDFDMASELDQIKRAPICPVRSPTWVPRARPEARAFSSSSPRPPLQSGRPVSPA